MKKLDSFVLQSFSFFLKKESFLKKTKNKFINFSLNFNKKKARYHKRFFSKIILCQQFNENFLLLVFFLKEILPYKWRKKVKTFVYASLGEKKEKIFKIPDNFENNLEKIKKKNLILEKNGSFSFLDSILSKKKIKKFILLKTKSIKYSKKIFKNLNGKSISFLKNSIEFRYIHNIYFKEFLIIQNNIRTTSNNESSVYIQNKQILFYPNLFSLKQTNLTSNFIEERKLFYSKNEEKIISKVKYFTKKKKKKLNNQSIEFKKKKKNSFYRNDFGKIFSHSFLKKKIDTFLIQQPLKN